MGVAGGHVGRGDNHRPVSGPAGGRLSRRTYAVPPDVPLPPFGVSRSRGGLSSLVARHSVISAADRPGRRRSQTTPELRGRGCALPGEYQHNTCWEVQGKRLIPPRQLESCDRLDFAVAGQLRDCGPMAPQKDVLRGALSSRTICYLRLGLSIATGRIASGRPSTRSDALPGAMTR